ncbi:MAG TPA: hypothetical protein VMU65_12820 [Candidatus Saccharimonadales bacterium]|nr:hypothetical protein [Candidatus Saccharimonadales bacterium]
MARVDPDDDSIERFVVRRYAYDPERHERRHQVVAAFDNHREYMKLISKLSEDLKRRRAAGESVDPKEHFNGVALEPGYRRRHAAGHLLSSASRHGVSLPDAVMDQLELPSNMGFLRSVSPSSE